MGGPGSGRYWDRKRTTVEDCLTLEINRLVREGLVRPWISGSRVWTNTFTGKRTASVGYQVEPVEGDDLILRLLYTPTIRGEKREVDPPIYLTTTRLHFGGVRWWLTCALIVRGVECSRRVTKLHLPPGAKYFGCRHCHDLTYQSCQDSHRFDALYEIVGGEIGIPGKIVKMVPDDKL